MRLLCCMDQSGKAFKKKSMPEIERCSQNSVQNRTLCAFPFTMSFTNDMAIWVHHRFLLTENTGPSQYHISEQG